MNDIKKLLGQRIRELRKSRGLTQEQLAEIIGIGTPNISYFETGKFIPAIETMQKIASALNVEIFELYMFKNGKSIDEIRNILTNVINSNENVAQTLYKFYTSVY